MEHLNNQITVRGSLQELPRFSHENHSRRFYRFILEVPRLSGAVDLLPVIAEEQLLNQIDLSGGCLLVFIFASAMTAGDGEPINQVVIQGPLCKEPIYRRTPLGREICDVMLAIPRAFRRADYLPCIAWGRTAQDISQCHTSDEICINGRLQSRIYTKLTEDGPQERTAYEISALSACIIEP